MSASITPEDLARLLAEWHRAGLAPDHIASFEPETHETRHARLVQLGAQLNALLDSRYDELVASARRLAPRRVASLRARQELDTLEAQRLALYAVRSLLRQAGAIPDDPVLAKARRGEQ